MKRFMLVSLMSCMLVGQTSCDWNCNAFSRGAANSMLKIGQGALIGTMYLGLCNLMSKWEPKEVCITRQMGNAILGCFVAGGALVNILQPGYRMLRNFTRPKNENFVEKARKNLDLSDDTKLYYVGAMGTSAAVLTGLGVAAYKCLRK